MNKEETVWCMVYALEFVRLRSERVGTYLSPDQQDEEAARKAALLAYGAVDNLPDNEKEG